MYLKQFMIMLFLIYPVLINGQNETIKIMPLGNSITQGEDVSINGITSFNTYRRLLWHQLVDTLGYNVDFIGSLNQNYACGSYDNPDFDLDHEGHWAWTVDEIVYGRSGTCNGNGRLGQWIQSVGIPDITLVHLGTNDCWGGQSTTSTISEMRALIDTLRSYNSEIIIFFCQIIGHQDPGVQAAIDDLNDSIPVLIASMTTPTSPIYIVDQASGFDPMADLYDVAHPNTSGEMKMANRFLSGLIPVLDSMTTVSGDLFLYLEAFIENIPSSGEDNFTEPDIQETITWKEIISQVLNENWTQAKIQAGSLDYKLLQFQDTIFDQPFYVLERTANGPHWGTYVFNPVACRANLVLMAPHARFDLNTGDEAAYCFLQSSSYALMLPGTHRCNSSFYSTCSGSTSVCSESSEDYRISDVAHTTSSAWQKTVEVLHDSLADPYFIQLHGFTKQPSDPYLIMSNGTRVIPVFDPLSELAKYLKIIDTVLTFRIGHIDLSWNRLLGFTNTNGRYINNSPNPCVQSATISEGRFLHIEQEKTRLRQDLFGWDKMARAIRATFPGVQCNSVVPADDQTRWYVREGLGGDGQTWATAHGDLASIIDLSNKGDSILVGQGIYYPTFSNDQNLSFDIRSGVSLFGGFPQSGGVFSEREPGVFHTELSADIGTPTEPSDNSFHTVRIISLDGPMILDGFRIYPGINPNGASILLSPETNPFLVTMINLDLLK